MTQEQKFIEASELYFPIDPNCNYEEKLLVDIKHRREYFIEGCEYQLKEQERSYSEEEVLDITKQAYSMGRSNYTIKAFNEWFEQFKKK